MSVDWKSLSFFFNDITLSYILILIFILVSFAYDIKIVVRYRDAVNLQLFPIAWVWFITTNKNNIETEMNVIDCQKVKKIYSGNLVLNDVDLSVDQGEFFGLIGMNGCGKSTLIKTILDLTHIDDGQIDLFQQPHTQAASRMDVAYLPDRFSPPADIKCGEFLNYMCRLYSVRQDSENINQTLLSLSLGIDVLQKKVSKLSKGMTQKIGLAACLLSQKKLLILDEPMSGLDPKSRVLFKQQLLKLKEKSVTVFFTSHALADVSEMADNMAVLHNGKILFSGSPVGFQEQYKGDDLEQAYMNCIAE